MLLLFKPWLINCCCIHIAGRRVHWQVIWNRNWHNSEVPSARLHTRGKISRPEELWWNTFDKPHPVKKPQGSAGIAGLQETENLQAPEGMSWLDIVGGDHDRHDDRRDGHHRGTSHHFFDVCGRQGQTSLLESPF